MNVCVSCDVVSACLLTLIVCAVVVSCTLSVTSIQLFILVVNQLDAQNLFYNKFISCLYMFRASCADRQEVKIVLYSLWYHHTYRCDGIITPIGVMIPEAV